MEIIKHTQINFKKWDEVILSSPLPLVFAQSFYLNATFPKWQALITNNYKSIMPITANKKLGINYLAQPQFTPQLGIYGKYNETIATEFITVLKQKYKYIDIELNASNTFGNNNSKTKRTFIIDYNKPYSYNSNTKRNIAKANKLGLVLNEVIDKEIITATKKYLHPFLKNKLKINPKHIKLFDQLLVNSIEKKYLKTFVVKNTENKVVAIAHFICNGKHALYLKGTSFDKAQNTGSMHFLMHYAIEYYKNNNAIFFDFGGGQSESMAQFFSGFGSTQLNYTRIKINNLPSLIKLVKK